MVCGSISSEGGFFYEKPTTTIDNYFFADAVLSWGGNAGIGIIGTNARNKLPKDIEPFYLHTDKMNANMKHTKAVRFFEMIFP